MDLQSAIHLIEESPDYEQYAKLKKVFRDRLEELKETDFTERGICYYYLLRILLQSHLLYETEECREYLEGMNENFLKQLKKYKKDRAHFDKSEIDDFFRLMERSYGSLEIIFRKKDFFEEEQHCYEKKMDYRRDMYRMGRKMMEWMQYSFFGGTARYGNSFLRWGVTSLLFTVLMAFVYYGVDKVEPDTALRVVSSATGHWYDYFYFSTSVITSMGFGDIVAKTLAAKIAVSLEGFLGFIMLGIFISLIQKKM